MADDSGSRSSPGTIRQTGRAVLALLRAGLSVGRRGRGGGLSLRTTSCGGAPDGTCRGEAGPVPVGVARDTARRLDRACRLLPWEPSCLVRAVALKRLLRNRGLAPAEVCVGVRRRDGSFAAHAWVELGGEIVGDAPTYVAQYGKLDDLEVFPE